MKLETRKIYTTFDGKPFNTVEAAHEYLDVLYLEALRLVAKELNQSGNGGINNIVATLDLRIDDLVAAKQIMLDKIMTKDAQQLCDDTTFHQYQSK